MPTKEEIRRMPKIDLHRHLDGDVNMGVLLRLGGNSGIKMPSFTEGGMLQYFADLKSRGIDKLFNEGFGLVTSLMQTKESLSRVAYEEARNLRDDGIIYAEIRFAPEFHTLAGLDYTGVIKAVSEGLKAGEKDFGVKTSIIVCINRASEQEKGIDIAVSALNCMDYGVVGIDLACDEAAYPPAKHAQAYYKTFDTPLKRTVHAGEFGNNLYQNMHASIHLLRANRLGHARTISQHEDIIKAVLKKEIGIEMCPESNMFMNLIRSRKELNIGNLLSNGVLVSVNSDDPAMFGYTLTDSLYNIAVDYGFTMEELRLLQENALKSSFLTENDKVEVARAIMKR